MGAAQSQMERIEQLLNVAVQPMAGFLPPTAALVFAQDGGMYESVTVVHAEKSGICTTTHAFVFVGEHRQHVLYMTYDEVGRMLKMVELFDEIIPFDVVTACLRIIMPSGVSVTSHSTRPRTTVDSGAILAAVRSELTQCAVRMHPHRIRFQYNYGSRALGTMASLNYRIIIERPLSWDPSKTDATMTIEICNDHIGLTLVDPSGYVIHDWTCPEASSERHFAFIQIEIAAKGNYLVTLEEIDEADNA
ncbi:hypothetical protein HGA91_05570 [candidate division WWE3 bacterium]|nr:hypothetical protein [candidate division WWE3 bacterium]